MGKLVILFAVLIMSLGSVYAVSSTLGESYAPKETMIGQFSDDILSTIYREQVRVVRDGHIDIAVEYDVKKLGNSNYIWLIAPQNAGDYTLIVRDLVAIVSGVPQVVDYEKDFTVSGEETDYSIDPGVILANDNFRIDARLYDDFSKTVDVDFPEQRQVTLVPGTNHIYFSIESIIGIQFVTIAVGKYSVPAYISGAESICGDGQLHGSEVCDGTNLNGNDCTTIPGEYVSGTLVCSVACLSFDTSGCELPQPPQPECDSGHLDLCVTAGTCLDAGGYWYGSVCNSEPEPSCGSEHLELCLTLGTCLDAGGYWYGSVCNSEPEPSCGSEHLELCLTDETCTNAGGYWYDDVCNQYEQGAECDSEHIGLCITYGTCYDAGGYWWNNTCNEEAEPSCGSEHLELCVTAGTCLDASGFWYNNTCNSESEPTEYICGDGMINGGEVCDCGDDGVCTFEELNQTNCTMIDPGYSGGNLSCSGDCLSFNSSVCEIAGSEPPTLPPSFRFDPGVIRSTILRSEEIPTYGFELINLGENPITGLLLDYDRDRFSIYPDSNISLAVNESGNFTLTLGNVGRNRVRGAVVAYLGEVIEYLIFTVNFTDDEGNVGTDYFRNSSERDSYYCSELDGRFCSSDEVCSVGVVSTLDGPCCTGQCQEQSSDGSKAWIGYLIVGIVLLDLVFRDIWILIKGSAQMSKDEFSELKSKYHLDQDDEEVVQEETVQKGTENGKGLNNSNSQPEIKSSESFQENTDEETTPVMLSNPQEKILLNPTSELESSNSEETFSTKREGKRLWIIYSFAALCIIIIILLALRRL